MHARQDPPQSLTRLATLQAGIVTHEQAVALGVSPRSVQRLVSHGLWRTEAPAVYSTTPHRSDFLSTAWAGVLAGGDRAMLGQEAAAHHLGLCSAAPTETVVLVPHGSRRMAPAGVRFVERRELPKSLGDLPSSCVEETVIDLCSEAPERMAEWVTAALRQRLTTVEQLRSALSRRKRLPAKTQVRKQLGILLDDAAGLESVLEHLYEENVRKPHGLPPGERQFRRGNKRHDVRIGRLLVELDGRLGHQGGSEVFRDLDRDNGAAADGLITLRYGYDDCWHRPCDVAAQIDAVLLQLGIESGAHRCPNCHPERD